MRRNSRSQPRRKKTALRLPLALVTGQIPAKAWTLPAVGTRPRWSPDLASSAGANSSTVPGKDSKMKASGCCGKSSLGESLAPSPRPFGRPRRAQPSRLRRAQPSRLRRAQPSRLRRAQASRGLRPARPAHIWRVPRTSTECPTAKPVDVPSRAKTTGLEQGSRLASPEPIYRRPERPSSRSFST